MTTLVQPGDLVKFKRLPWSDYRVRPNPPAEGMIALIITIKSRTEQGSGATVFDMRILVEEDVEVITVDIEAWDEVVEKIRT